MDSFQLIELIAVFFGIINVYLLTRQNIWAWPAGIIMVSIYVYIFFVSKLYSDFILHIIYVILNVYGWWYWSQKSTKNGQDGKDAPTVPVTHLSNMAIAGWTALIVAGTGIWGYIMDTHTDADFAYFDAFTTVASLVAQYLLARKKLENWIIWIVVDLVAINIYFLKGLYFTSALYGIFLALCVLGLIEWKRSMKTASPDLA